jgi:hypothetical protein
MATSRVTDKDKGWARLLRTAAAPGVQLAVGIINDEEHKDGNGKTVGEIGEIHELGLGNNPARPWLRPVVDGRASHIKAYEQRIAEAVVQGKVTPEAGMNLLGLELVGMIKARIQHGIAPQLKPATIIRKGGKATPLIYTSQFIGLISHKVKPLSKGKLV